MKPHILFLTGAGASSDSGIRTYRGEDGYYKNKDFLAENLSIDVWKKSPEMIWKILFQLMEQVRQNQAGPTYELIKKLSESYNVTIFTQNVDGYSKYATEKVHELHGNLESMYCETCDKFYKFPVKKNLALEQARCVDCDQYCKPNIVLYGESAKLNLMNVHKYFEKVVIIGTTMQFPYLRGLVNKWKQKGAKIYHINPDPRYLEHVKKNEIWQQTKSSQGLVEIFPDQLNIFD